MDRVKYFLVLLMAITTNIVVYAQWNPEALKLAQVMDKVSRYYVDSIDDNEVVESTIVHMLHELDPHSSYLSKEELAQLNEQLEGEFEGIGVSFNVLEDTIYIIRAISGGPSESVGIHAGDRIVKVDGETVAGTGITTRDVQRLLKGPKGTRVDVSVQRRGERDLLEFSITRDKIPVFSLDASYMINDRIGYVKLARFSHTSIDEFENALKSLKQEGMKDLILDLSGNGGGWLPVAVELTDHFLSGNKDMAKAELGKFINSYSKSSFRAEAMYLLSQIYLQEEDWMDNIINLERLVREYPDSQYLSEALYGLCFSYFKKDEYEKAIKVGERYLKDYSSLEYGDDILYTKAVCWEKLENQEKAIFDYQDLISKFPQSPYVEKVRERLEALKKE